MSEPIFIIGPGKSGTSFIYNVLKSSGIYMGILKESNYYLSYPAKAKSNYLSEYQEQRIIDISNTYFYNPQIATRLRQDFPNAIIISIKRPPVERVISHYLYMLSRGDAFEPFSEYILTNPALFLSIKHEVFSEIWSRIFKKNYIELEFEHINKNDYIREIFSKLEIQVKGDHKEIERYETQAVKNGKFKSIVLKIGSKFLRRWFPKLFQRLKQSSLQKLFFRTRATPVNKQKIGKEIREFFNQYEK